MVAIKSADEAPTERHFETAPSRRSSELFSDFILQATMIDDGIVVVCTAPSGEAFITVNETDTKKATARTLALHREIDKCIARGNLEKERKKLETHIAKVGQFLSDIVLKDEIIGLLNIALGQASRLAQEVRIRIMIGSEFLNIFPWEILIHQGSFLSLQYDFVRHPFVMQPVLPKFKATRRPRILVVCADPKNNLDGKEHIKRISSALGHGATDLRVLQSPDTNHANIADRIFEGADVLHVLAHGRFLENGKSGTAYLIIDSDPPGEKEERLPLAMLESFTRVSPMQLVVLSACRSDQGASYTNVAMHQKHESLAHALIKAGVPCVIGMTHPISKIGAEILTSRLYKDIGKSRSLEPNIISNVMRRVRLELFAHSESLAPSDWFTPVLYSRSQTYSDQSAQIL